MSDHYYEKTVGQFKIECHLDDNGDGTTWVGFSIREGHRLWNHHLNAPGSFVASDIEVGVDPSPCRFCAENPCGCGLDGISDTIDVSLVRVIKGARQYIWSGSLPLSHPRVLFGRVYMRKDEGQRMLLKKTEDDGVFWAISAHNNSLRVDAISSEDWLAWIGPAKVCDFIQFKKHDGRKSYIWDGLPG